jgi:hypothetical protein
MNDRGCRDIKKCRREISGRDKEEREGMRQGPSLVCGRISSDICLMKFLKVKGFTIYVIRHHCRYEQKRESTFQCIFGRKETPTDEYDLVFRFDRSYQERDQSNKTRLYAFQIHMAL